ncbi:hypothetical protein QE417_000230 [Mucilaginibacter terrae]|uniref:Uncharacterized protein n=1 Tax=Mucilaginibacter terrae TaxID=1955052 RepID=A0ABU3GMZ8_9SPHI|nr:hypothetical protein [Mucilaginibacter terrae]
MKNFIDLLSSVSLSSADSDVHNAYDENQSKPQ